jgi:hypothetical protein
MAYAAIPRLLHLATETVRQFRDPYHVNHCLLNAVWTSNTGIQVIALPCVGHLILWGTAIIKIVDLKDSRVEKASMYSRYFNIYFLYGIKTISIFLLERGKFRAQTAHRGNLDASHHNYNWISILLYIWRNFEETSWYFVPCIYVTGIPDVQTMKLNLSFVIPVDYMFHCRISITHFIKFDEEIFTLAFNGP